MTTKTATHTDTQTADARNAFSRYDLSLVDRRLSDPKTVERLRRLAGPEDEFLDALGRAVRRYMTAGMTLEEAVDAVERREASAAEELRWLTDVWYANDDAPRRYGASRSPSHRRTPARRGRVARNKSPSGRPRPGDDDDIASSALQGDPECGSP